MNAQLFVKSEFSEVEGVVRNLLPDHIAVAATDPQTPRSAQYPEEAAALPPMRALRRREFLAGREALRLAFAELHVPPTAIAMRDDRAPDLPNGVCASLSHTAALCVAVADRDTRTAGLGLDLEEAEPLDFALWDTVCTRTERAWLNAQPQAAQGLWAKHIFCAKEAAYKCQFALSGMLVDFDAFDVTFCPGRKFFATFRQTVGPFQTNDRICGKYDQVADHIVTAAHIPA